MGLILWHRRDPWWALDGPAARRARRRRQLRAVLAFVASLAAVSGAGALWGLQLGLAGATSLHLVLPPF
jgi:hypothetical protein